MPTIYCFDLTEILDFLKVKKQRKKIKPFNRWNCVFTPPCRREKYASVAFFMSSGLQVLSVNISKSLARDVLRSLHLHESVQHRDTKVTR